MGDALLYRTSAAPHTLRTMLLKTGSEKHILWLVLVLLSIFVGEIFSACIGSSTTYAPGEFSLTKKKWVCLNAEQLTLVTDCTGTCDSSQTYTFIPGRRPKPTTVCNRCRFTMERKPMRVNCIRTDGSDATMSRTRNIHTYRLWVRYMQEPEEEQ